MRKYLLFSALRVKMKLLDLLEAPISDYGTIGDFDDPNASMKHASDRRAVTAQPVVQRIKQAWEKTPFDFAMFFANVPGMEKYLEQGYVSDMTVKREFPEAYERIASAKERGDISVVFTNNEGAGRVSLTPWIIAHRISHALVQPWNRSDPRQGEQNKAFSEGTRILHGTAETILSMIVDRHGVRVVSSKMNPHLFQALYEHIGTMKSARSGLLDRPNEFYHELFAQYLLSGEISFNELDDSFFERLAKVSEYDNRDPDQQRIADSVNRAHLPRLKVQLTKAFEEGLKAAQGKIIFM